MARYMAHAAPAMPPPMMTKSASRVERACESMQARGWKDAAHPNENVSALDMAALHAGGQRKLRAFHAVKRTPAGSEYEGSSTSVRASTV